jgi:hypothetical protein
MALIGAAKIITISSAWYSGSLNPTASARPSSSLNQPKSNALNFVSGKSLVNIKSFREAKSLLQLIVWLHRTRSI